MPNKSNNFGYLFASDSSGVNRNKMCVSARIANKEIQRCPWKVIPPLARLAVPSDCVLLPSQGGPVHPPLKIYFVSVTRINSLDSKDFKSPDYASTLSHLCYWEGSVEVITWASDGQPECSNLYPACDRSQHVASVDTLWQNYPPQLPRITSSWTLYISLSPTSLHIPYSRGETCPK